MYVLRSLKDGWLYVGQTSNLADRLRRHNLGKVRSTRERGPFEIAYFEEYKTRSEAIKQEKHFKSPEGGLLKREILSRGVAQSGSAPVHTDPADMGGWESSVRIAPI